MKRILLSAMALLSLGWSSTFASRQLVVEMKGGSTVKYVLADDPVVTFSDTQMLIKPAKTLKTINGHEYVDLGLPSGTKWATMNVGASSPEEYGDYYAWGETKTKSEYSWSTYMGGMSSYKKCGKSKDPLKDYVKPNNKSIAGTEYDVAHVKWGGTWKMPTYEQIQELYNSDYCTTTWTSNYNGIGVAGYIITSKMKGYAGNSIFLPAAGYRNGSSLLNEGSFGDYGSATPGSHYARNAYYLFFRSGNFSWHSGYRCVGQSVRPVSE